MTKVQNSKANRRRLPVFRGDQIKLKGNKNLLTNPETIVDKLDRLSNQYATLQAFVDNDHVCGESVSKEDTHIINKFKEQFPNKADWEDAIECIHKEILELSKFFTPVN